MILRRIISHVSTALAGLLLVCVLCASFEAAAQTPASCQTYEQAFQKYLTGALDEAIAMAEACLESSTLSKEERKQFYRLLGLSYIAKDLEDLAKDAIARLLDLIPNYMPDPVSDNPKYVKIVKIVRRERAEEAEAQDDEPPVQAPPPQIPPLQDPLIETIDETERGGEHNHEISIDNETIETLRTEWETEYVIATGTVPVVNKYNDPTRDRFLARRGAILDAQRNLAQRVGAIRITETVTMADLSTTDVVRSQLKVILQSVEVLTEQYDETNNLYKVTIRMPKLKVLKVVEEYSQHQ